MPPKTTASILGGNKTYDRLHSNTYFISIVVKIWEIFYSHSVTLKHYIVQPIHTQLLMCIWYISEIPASRCSGQQQGHRCADKRHRRPHRVGRIAAVFEALANRFEMIIVVRLVARGFLVLFHPTTRANRAPKVARHDCSRWGRTKKKLGRLLDDYYVCGGWVVWGGGVDGLFTFGSEKVIVT